MPNPIAPNHMNGSHLHRMICPKDRQLPAEGQGCLNRGWAGVIPVILAVGATLRRLELRGSRSHHYGLATELLSEVKEASTEVVFDVAIQAWRIDLERDPENCGKILEADSESARAGMQQSYPGERGDRDSRRDRVLYSKKVSEAIRVRYEPAARKSY